MALRAEADTRRRPPNSPAAILSVLARDAPHFANTLHQQMLHGESPTSSFPALVAAEFADDPATGVTELDLGNPLQVAILWWTALGDPDFDEQLRFLTYQAPAFGDYEWAVELLEGFSIASQVYQAVDAPEGDVAFVKFVPEVAQTSQAFEAFRVTSARFMTLVRVNSDWRVWGLGEQMVSARQMRA